MTLKKGIQIIFEVALKENLSIHVIEGEQIRIELVRKYIPVIVYRGTGKDVDEALKDLAWEINDVNDPTDFGDMDWAKPDCMF